jgi:predicted ATPase/serine phosphatase RsbU (regulator of sigma subunit)/tRNA A-37 threonylcarbamoyl transferase component Bud32
MISFPGYQIKEKLFESNNSFVFRAQKVEPKLPVVIKVLKGEYPDPERIVRFKREFEILKSLSIDGIIKAHSLDNYNKSWAIILEDFGAESIKKILDKRRLNVYEFLRIAISLSEILGQLHQRNIIHKNINSTNIVWNEETDKVKIIDFGIATVLSKEIASIQNPKEFEGTLSYISPEQTGRMNRMIDYRSDMYSLGVTLYEIMTGQLPFVSRDEMELIHCHIAKTPVPPHKLLSSFFSAESKGAEILSGIIMKLMSKTAEDRYLSYFGLKQDLEKCYKHLKKNQTLSGLVLDLGETDFSDRFQIPQKLYGREAEITTLMDTFKRICTRPYGGQAAEMMMVTGYAGIGKSALVNEIRIPIVEKRGYFISGKFDRYKYNIPYSALTKAFQDLVRQILMESEWQVEQWKTDILKAVGPNGQIIIDVIPEVERIIGKQPAVPELPPHETQNRFNMYFQNFILTFADESHPLTIFLDDLQWADIPTLKLLERLMLDSRTRYMFIIGAYRDNETDSTHPLITSLTKIKNENAIVNTIVLSPLESGHINQLLSESLKCSIPNAENLGKLCLAKTNGNPFFLIQFLNSLADQKLIEFDTRNLKWEWDYSEIANTDITSNVVELMTSRIQKLPEMSKNILKLASCIGNGFDLDILAIINEKPAVETANELNEALNSGLIQPIGEGYRLAEHLDFLNGTSPADKLEHKIQYKFLHDRVHQAAYSLMGDEYKSIHLKIGKLLLQRFSKSEREERIFEIVNHLNPGIDLITSQAEKNDLAELNLFAGRKAKAATAYEIAFQYLNTGLELLGAKAWKDNYALALEMNIETAEASYLTGNFEKMDKLAGEISNHAETLLDRIRIYEIVIQSFMARGRLKECIGTAFEILKQLGIHIKPEPTRFSVFLSLIHVRMVLSTKSIEDLKNLPVMTDPHKLAAMRILMNAASSAFYTNILVALILAFKMVLLSIRYGNSPFSPFAYGLYAIIVNGIIGKTTPGYKLGEFSIELLKRFNIKEYETRVNLLFNLFVRHWRDKLGTTIEPFKESFQRGLETGDYEFAAYCSVYTGIHMLHSGVNLDIVEAETKKSAEMTTKLNQELIMIAINLARQTTLNLMGKSKNRILLVGESYNELEMAPRLIESNNNASLGSLYSMKALLCFVFDNKKESLDIALKAEKCKASLIGTVFVSLISFYSSLIYLSHCDDATTRKRLFLLKKAHTNQKLLKKWARYAPENFLHKWHLVEAERHRIHGNCLKAMKHYDKAVSLARKNGFTHEEALSNELAAKCFLSNGYEKTGTAYMKEAFYLYTVWGANAKVDHLKETYTELLYTTPQPGGKERENELNIEGLESTQTERFDLASVQKASQAISGEIHLNKLLEKLMHIVIVNAGAQNGFFLLTEEDGLFVEGEAFAGREEVTVLQHVPYTDQNNIALIVVNYVLRVNEMVVVDDAANHEVFKADPYITRNNLKSILCMPLFFKNKISGILYLENNLTSGAFTPERVDILKILTGQIVISIENARLYKSLEEYNLTLEQKVTDRTLKIENQNKEITSSIKYASRIQNALLPPDEELKRILPSYFILSIPKDIVSGDFYWFTLKDDKVIFAVADCTGHGVPGAFMSILGISFLNEIANKTVTFRANELLNQLSGQLKKSLHQTGNIIETKDGMEMGLCVIDFAKQKLQYAGAFRPLYLISGNKLKEFPGDSMPIGLYESEDLSFTNTEVLFGKDDMIYLFSDGYVDQLGGKDRKTFRSEKFKKLLIQIHNLPPEQQRTALRRKHIEWKGNIEQVDDILVAGIRL